MTTAVSVWAGETWEPDGTEEFDALPGDIKLVSAVSTMEGASRNVGKFWHSDRGAANRFTDTLDVVPLMVRTNRAFFEAGTSTPLCRSNDGKTIEPGQPLWQRESVKVKDGLPPIEVGPEPRGCETCPFSRWEGNTEPPLCGEAKVLFMIRKDDDSPARYRFSGVAIKPLTKFIRQEVVSAHRPLYSWRLTISSVEVARGGKKFFEPKIVGTDLTLDEAKAYGAIVAQQRQRFEMPEEADADFHEPRTVQATNGAPDDVRDFSWFWSDVDKLGMPREDVVSIVAPRRLSDLLDDELAKSLVDIEVALDGTHAALLTAGERRVIVETVRGDALPPVTPDDLSPRQKEKAAR